MDYSKELTRLCEYSPLVRIVRDEEGVKLSWKDTEPREEEKWQHELCLTVKDADALIKMLKDALAG